MKGRERKGGGGGGRGRGGRRKLISTKTRIYISIEVFFSLLFFNYLSNPYKYTFFLTYKTKSTHLSLLIRPHYYNYLYCLYIYFNLPSFTIFFTFLISSIVTSIFPLYTHTRLNCSHFPYNCLS